MSCRIAIVHDWLITQRGGENVLDAICELFPQAELFTLIYHPEQISKNIRKLKHHTSILQKFPQSHRRYRHFLPLMPWAIENFDLSEFDLIISSSHCVAKGVIKRQDSFHISYIHAPMRYMWDRFDDYFGNKNFNFLTRTMAKTLRPYFQSWDRRSTKRVDHLLANSNFISKKIEQYYGRKADVIHPFCESNLFSRPRSPQDYYLMVTALVPYKRVDLAIKAFNKMKKSLVIVGDGPDLNRLKSLAENRVKFVGTQNQEALAIFYSQCRALIFPGIEDFGIVPIEAMAAGSPVIAFNQGGVLETVTQDTGIFFQEQTIESLIEAVKRFENMQFDERACRKQGGLFTRKKFQQEFLHAIQRQAPKHIQEMVDSRIWSSLEIADTDLPLALP